MRREERTHRFGPEIWATIRETGEHVKIECWLQATREYRARSRKRGLMFLTEEELDEVLVHPEAHLGKHWSRCPAVGCGAPLTPELPVCPRCQGLTCPCGRCRCIHPAKTTPRAKTVRKKAAAQAR
jgi:hypothetical protein